MFKRRGVTLIEALIAVVILGAFLLTIASAFFLSLGFVERSREVSVAAMAVQEEMERVRSMKYEDILSLGPAFTAEGFGRLGSPVGTVSVDDIYGDAYIRRVTVSVNWTTKEGKIMSRSKATLVTRRGINRQ